jgi:phosphoglycolate phosphatase
MTLILFDCDGTLVDSQNAIVSAMNAAFHAHGLKLAPRQSVIGVVGLSLVPAITRLLPRVDRDIVEQVAESYKRSFAEMRSQPEHDEPLFPGAREVLQGLAARPGVRLGIATGKSIRGVDAVIEREGWHGLFATIQTADDNPSKPHPGMVLRAMAEVDARPFETLMVGDTTFDVDMARAAGAHAIGVAWGYHDPRSLSDCGAHAMIERFDELPATVDRLLCAVAAEPSGPIA